MGGVATILPFNDTLGDTIPPDTNHAVSVSLPTWRSNVGYEEGEEWVVKKMKCGYPRFFIYKSIDKLAETIVSLHGSVDTEKAMLFPTQACATRCKDFMRQRNPTVDTSSVRILNFGPHVEKIPPASEYPVLPQISAVVYPKQLWPTAKGFWQHTGEGVQSRRAEFCHRALESGYMVLQASTALPSPRIARGPKRYQRTISSEVSAVNGNSGSAADTPNNGASVQDSAQFVEERFGRNLNTAFAAQAKLAIRRRIAGTLTADVDLPESLMEPEDLARERKRDVPEFSVDDVYLFPCGMNAIFTAHRTMLLARPAKKSIMYGFPYVDTLKVLEKFGPGAVFFGHGDTNDIDKLEAQLKAGDRFLSLFCEFPGNPLLKSPDLKRLRSLADQYGFAIIIDETVGNFLNVHVLPYADVVVSSLTKIFSGDGNVMGGAMILNPHSTFYHDLRKVLDVEYEDNQFEEDSIYLERNSRDFVTRIARINTNAEAVADVLRASSKVLQVYYPKYSPTRKFYDACRLPEGGFGGLLSATFSSVADASLFYDHLECYKGPSLGTNFTLASPFVLLAHYNELDWAAQYGCEESLVRFSIGLEPTEVLVQRFETALAAIL